ncbi:MAG TPA: glycosyltransferase family 4 protein [Candidatus Ratteibacteria bacterium]|jgi:glycosyltransferase involved in cell wall biosynthesis|uniref:2-deoxystreptamine glucosyltransferase n=1 Tax=candidate division TA06 bacterium ADurb.Bin131 TaxID=1852827 RepID=A0A1V6CDJ6_UNCT6|nr:MAG: 2-deoxystreptamine glucosyltransferase [candidate division TA06 bacterium ADurb.Bin131]HON05991.1 glycosyltransferase family 4 protein [bacterium]HPC28964.1 glycosyltransferase family 4 protein [bacterium]HRS05626.1 glycosyltransferase family 4 protein [Candidatus Ratteibacteria bacterium]HRV03749.1 glycosyltransferase family 4 protein [Candidatus Ratteibacteria bacterium]
MLPEMDIGGVEEGTYDLACGMKKLGVNITVISGPGRYIPLLEKEQIKWINLPTSQKTLRVFFDSTRKLKQIIEQEKPDILHCRSRFPAWIAHHALKNNSRTRFVTSIHGYLKFPPYSKIIGRGERVIAISDALAEFVIKKLGATPENVRVIHNGIRFHPYVNLKKQKHSGFVIGGIGRLTKIKGFQNLIQAVSEVKKNESNITLYIVGDGPYRKNLEILDKKLDVKTNFLTGRASEFLPQMDLLVAPHIETEPFIKGKIPWLGRSVYESQLSGIPVITTLRGIQKTNFIKTDTALIVPPADITALTHAIKYALNNPEEMLKIAENGKRFVLSHFSVEGMVNKTLKVYEELLLDNPGKA